MLEVPKDDVHKVGVGGLKGGDEVCESHTKRGAVGRIIIV